MEVSDNEIIDFFAKGKNGDITGEKWSFAYQKKVRHYLENFFNWCVESGHIPYNPINRIPLDKNSPKPPPQLTDEQKRLRHFKELYRKYYGQELSDQESIDILDSLVVMLRTLRRGVGKQKPS